MFAFWNPWAHAKLHQQKRALKLCSATFRGQKILGHTMIALHYGCLTSKPTPSYVRSPPVLQSAFYALINSSSDHPNLPRLPRSICLSCQSWGYGIRNFTAARGLDICIPRGGPWALDTHVFESVTDKLGEHAPFTRVFIIGHTKQ